MCSINHNKKTIFIHIPKTGGSYISEILEKYYGFKTYYLRRPDHKSFCHDSIKDRDIDTSSKKHENKIHGTLMYYKTSPHINATMGMTKDKWENYFIFTFVRNPYDRIVSGWNYCNKYNIPFGNYININFHANSFDYWHVFMNQVRHLIGNKGTPNVDYIGKFENLEADLREVLIKIGFNNKDIRHIPKIKNSRTHKNYKSYYINNQILEKVNNIISDDLEFLDYAKVYSITDL